MGAQWKHKGRIDAGARKGAVFSRLAKEIIVAARTGNPDPDANNRLRAALENARKNSMPRDTVERALKKGRGETDDDVVYETVSYEGFGPHQVPLIVECLTENRNRTASDIRQLFKSDGQLGASGAVQWMFDRRGLVEASHEGGMDPVEAAIEAGADDVKSWDDGAEFICGATSVDEVSRALRALGWVISSAELGWVVKNPVVLAGEARDEVTAFLESFDDNQDVHRMYVGLADE